MPKKGKKSAGKAKGKKGSSVKAPFVPPWKLGKPLWYRPQHKRCSKTCCQEA